MQRLGTGAQFSRVHSETLFTVALENRSFRGATLYSQVLYIRQVCYSCTIPIKGVMKEHSNGSYLRDSPMPLYKSLSPQNQ
jgi:hypothetical protein